MVKKKYNIKRYLLLFSLMIMFTLAVAITQATGFPPKDNMPIVGDDNNVWGTKLNKNYNDTRDTLLVSLNENGTLKLGLNGSFENFNVTGTFITGTINGTFANFSQQMIVLGNVGIGTVNPTVKLVVIGNVNISDSEYFYSITTKSYSSSNRKENSSIFITSI